MKNRIHIGGEPYISPFFYLKKKKFNFNDFLISKYKGKYINLTGGAYFSILNILRNINLENSDKVLLPSYLCPSILKPFKKMNVNYQFYKINQILEIDLDDLYKKIDKHVKVIFFINYFGYSPAKIVIDELKKIQKQGIYLFEDCAQSFLPSSSSIGDFKFNSFRKFIPVDGGLLISNQNLKTSKKKKLSKYFYIRHLARLLRYLNKSFSLQTTELFIRLIALSDKEKYYYNEENSSFSYVDKALFSKFDINKIYVQRRNNFKKITKILKEKVIFNRLIDDIFPLGVPIIINHRDRIRNGLIKKNIFCPIHWALTDEIDKKEFEESWYLSNHILTIPVHESIGILEVEYFKSNWEEIYESLS